MRVLVTGGAGYIGSFMVKRLLTDKHDVVVVDSLERGHKEVVDNRARLIVGNLLGKQFVKKLFVRFKFEAVIHFAGYISMSESMQNPFIYFQNNTLVALQLLEEMRKNHLNNFIFSSTAGVYGNPIKVPIPEDHSKNPTNPYGESKLMVEKILAWYKGIYGINYVSLRYFNAAGASLDGSMGEDHNPESHIIPLAIKAALNKSEFNLFGTDYKTSDGTCIRDYIHVIDLVEAHVLALNKLQSEKGGFYYNVGTGKGYSNRQVIEMVKKVSGIDFEVSVQPRRPGDADELVANPSSIQKDLGFVPEYSSLETIVKTAWEWHRNKKVT